MDKLVDIYLPLDSRDEPNAEVWPVTEKQLYQLLQVIETCGWKGNVLNPDKPISSVSEGLTVIKKAKGSRFINFMGGWAYPDFSVSPMWQLPKNVPKLMLGSAISDYPGAVGLLATSSGLAQMNIGTDRLFIENFEEHDRYKEAIQTFLEKGAYSPAYPDPIEIIVSSQQTC